MLPNAQTPDEDARITERLLAFLRPDAPDWLPPEPVLTDDAAVPSLIRRLAEERATAEWAHAGWSRERQEAGNLRACIVRLQVELRDRTEARWRERFGLVAAGALAVALLWVVRGGAL
jgi:hypothetical protein